jgi:NAD-dependent SIR2 family protein deacetylase
LTPPTDPRLTELERRREFNAGKQVDNSTLYAGSPMYYYCETCGAHVATKPEGWWQDPPPPKHCPECQELIEAGLLDSGETYDTWLREHNHKPVPR